MRKKYIEERIAEKDFDLGSYQRFRPARSTSECQLKRSRLLDVIDRILDLDGALGERVQVVHIDTDGFGNGNTAILEDLVETMEEGFTNFFHRR